MTAEGDATRRRMLAIVAGEPGITLRSLAAKAGISLGTAWQHVGELRATEQLSEGPCPHCGRTMMVVEGEVADGSRTTC